jgi:hypothetical protein
MLKILLSSGLVVLLLQGVNAMPILASAQAGQEKVAVEKVKAEVARRMDKKTRVRVKLQDGSKLKGNISQAGEYSFTLTDPKTGQSRTLAYREVTQVKGAGGLSILAKIGIGIGIAFGALALVYATNCEGFGC